MCQVLPRGVTLLVPAVLEVRGQVPSGHAHEPCGGADITEGPVSHAQRSRLLVLSTFQKEHHSKQGR